MRKIYKIIQYVKIDNSNTVYRNDNVFVPTKTAYPNYGIGQIATHDDLNLDFDSEDEAIELLASKGFTDEQLHFFSIELQIRK